MTGVQTCALPISRHRAPQPHEGLTGADSARDITKAVSEALVNEQLRRSGEGLPRLSPTQERDIACRLVRDQLDRSASRRLAMGRPLPTAWEEQSITDAVLATVLGLGRIQPLLEDPDISDIHIRGCDPVWLKRRDGSRVMSHPVADSDDDLVELIRLAAVRAGSGERRFDAANPELNLQLPDGSRLFAVMAV